MQPELKPSTRMLVCVSLRLLACMYTRTYANTCTSQMWAHELHHFVVRLKPCNHCIPMKICDCLVTLVLQHPCPWNADMLTNSWAEIQCCIKANILNVHFWNKMKIWMFNVIISIWKHYRYKFLTDLFQDVLWACFLCCSGLLFLARQSWRIGTYRWASAHQKLLWCLGSRQVSILFSFLNVFYV